MSGIDQNKNLAPNITSKNMFNSILASNPAMNSTSIEQAQHFLNQLLYNNSYHSMMQLPNLFGSNFFTAQNYYATSMPINYSEQFKQNYSLSIQSNQCVEKKDSANKNTERLKYLDNLVSHSVQGSNLELEKALIQEHRLFPLLKFMFEKCELTTLNAELLMSANKVFLGNFLRFKFKKFKKIENKQFKFNLF